VEAIDEAWRTTRGFFALEAEQKREVRYVIGAAKLVG
jgi:hypothetical protein